VKSPLSLYEITFLKEFKVESKGDVEVKIVEIIFELTDCEKESL